MTSLSRNMIFGSMGIAGLVSVISVIDMAIGIPFNRQMMMDVLFLLSSAAVFYMSYDAYQDLK